MIEAAFTRILIWRKILITSNFMIILLLTISQTNNCDICYLRCPLVNITWIPSSYRTSVIHYMQAAKQLFDAVMSNDVPTVRKFLDLGTDVDLAYVRYQMILSHPFLLYSDSPPSIQFLSVCLPLLFLLFRFLPCRRSIYQTRPLRFSSFIVSCPSSLSMCLLPAVFLSQFFSLWSIPPLHYS